ncbi:hypothetical protein [Archaeoglobus profundus]|uniref:Uncharacterized protein n=1 Tax=Archaeoglobus profundus (strain DSM 5631 / JCM 9629 / NBRC 100127 / Av18) TaxID=572546 RepID=D2RGZ1_ARCPA|nr:hypothetical protein [Archaeoglobus profundus]ADB57566.1 hypothetical protein Arcpr_0500 [Archaeoglobus profundus DSM 5631]
MDKWAVIGVAVGFLFGFNGIATIFNMLGQAVNEVQAHLTQASTLILLIIAIVLIVKVRILASLLVGAIIGAILNFVLKANGIDVVGIVWSEILKAI